MGNLITETPYSEVTATLELLDRLGVDREGLKKFRKASSFVQFEVARLMQEGERAMSKVSGENNLTIDCNAAPFIPEGWKVEEHQKCGILTWSQSLTALHLDEDQQNGKVIEGNKLRKKLKGLPILNANVLDFLLANPHLIPEEWKGKAVFFWGTIYRYSDGRLSVRDLYWSDDRWRWLCNWLGRGWSGDNPSAVSAS